MEPRYVGIIDGGTAREINVHSDDLYDLILDLENRFPIAKHDAVIWDNHDKKWIEFKDRI